MDDKLTARQQAFLDGLIQGKTQYQSYIDAGYKTEGKKRSYIDREASVLAANPKISQRFKRHKTEIAEELKKKDLWTKEDSVRTLRWLVGKGIDDIGKKGVRAANQQAVVSATKELNAVLGIGLELEIKAETYISQKEAAAGEEGKLTLEEKRLRIEKLQAEIDKLRGDNIETEDLDDVIGDIYGSEEDQKDNTI